MSLCSEPMILMVMWSYDRVIWFYVPVWSCDPIDPVILCSFGLILWSYWSCDSMILWSDPTILLILWYSWTCDPMILWSDHMILLMLWSYDPVIWSYDPIDLVILWSCDLIYDSIAFVILWPDPVILWSCDLILWSYCSCDRMILWSDPMIQLIPWSDLVSWLILWSSDLILWCHAFLTCWYVCVHIYENIQRDYFFEMGLLTTPSSSLRFFRLWIYSSMLLAPGCE